MKVSYNYLFLRILITAYLLQLSVCAFAQKYYFRNISPAQGLSHSTVFCITQDHKGFMWFGSREGLNRFDSKNIRTFYFNSSLPTVEASRINALCASGKALYAGTGEGLFGFDYAKEKFEKIRLGSDTSVFVNTICPSPAGILVGTRTGLYCLKADGTVAGILKNEDIRHVVNYTRGVFLVLSRSSVQLVTINGDRVLQVPTRGLSGPFQLETLYKDREGQIWAGTSQGLLVFDPQGMQFVRPAWFGSETELVRTIVEDNDRQLWIGTETGAYRYAKNTRQLTKYEQSFGSSPSHLADKSIYSSFVSSEGIVWLGSYFGGVNYTLPASYSFQYLLPERNAKALSGKAVSQIVADAQRNMWVATEDGGVTVFDENLNYKQSFNTSNGLSDNNTHAIYPESNGTVWIGTFLGGLNRLDTQTGQIQTFTNDPNNPNSLSNKRVFALHKDRQGTLWVGTLNGLNILDEKTNQFALAFPGRLADKFIYDIHQDKTGDLWFATRFDGIYRCDSLRRNLQHFTAKSTPAIRSDQIISIYEDQAANLWFGTLDGKVAFFEQSRQRFSEPNFLAQIPDKTIYGILEDNQRNMWFSTNRGLLKYNPNNQTVKVFDKGSGLLTTQFNFKSFYKNQSGTLFFGSVNGLCYFRPEVLQKNIFSPKCYFTGLKIFNEAVGIGENEVLQKSIDETEKLEIEHRQNVLTLDFVALNYPAAGNNHYTYYLEGFEENWNERTDKSSVTYTNLPFGNYTFHLKTYQSDGTLADSERTLQIKVNPPLWLSPLAILFYLGLIGLAIYYYGRFVRFLNEQKLAVQVERLDKEKNQELNAQKINFFTFISNEFKSPLTLIVAVIDEIVHAEPLRKEDLNRNVNIIKKNARHLQMLIEQLTAIRKSSESTDSELTKLDLVGFIKENLLALQPLITSRNLTVKTVFSEPYVHAVLDSTKLELVLANIFFNIFSKCPSESSFELGTAAKTSAEGDSESVFHLSLSGPLPEEFMKTLPRLTGSEPMIAARAVHSISENLLVSLVKNLRGKFWVDTKATPTIHLQIPYRVSAEHWREGIGKETKSVVGRWVADYELADPNPVLEDLPPGTEKAKILIAGKNAELLDFLKRHFGEHYEAITATSHAKASRKAETTFPDLVLCDADLVNELDENLCQTLKNNARTSLVPVILMLENDSGASRIAALAVGSDAMIGKPFKLQELDLLVKNTLNSRQLIRARYAGSVLAGSESPVFQNNKSADFLLRFTDMIEKNHQESTLTVDTLAEAMQCSRSSLHTKIKTMTGLSTIEFLNDYRLKIAHQLLTRGQSVAEAADAVGFNDPNYFSRIFKRKYGESPSRMQKMPQD